MAAFARTELDLIGLARQDNQAAVQLFAIRDGKLIGRDVFLLDAAARGARRRGPGRASSSSSTRGRRRSRREVLVPRAARRGGRPRGVPGRASGRPGPSPRAAARREARAPRARRSATRPRRSRASRPAGWPTRARPWAPSRSWPRRSGWPGPPMRIECYDISNFQGSAVGRQHGRLRGRQAADRRVPPLPDQDGRGPQRLRQPPGGPPAALPAGPAGRGGQRGGAPLARCPTS